MDGSKMKRSETAEGTRFGSLLEKSDLDALEEAWLDEISRAGESRDPPDPGEFLAVADALMDGGQGERVTVLLDLLFPLFQEGNPSHRLEVLRRMVLASPRREDLRSDFARCFREAHQGDPFCENCLDVAGVETAADVGAALKFLDQILQFRPGTCVFHGEGWGVGVVERIDPSLRQAVVDLEKKRHHRIDLRVIMDILKALPPDHFLALARGDGESLREMADSDPVKLVETVIVSFGNPQELKAIKARLVPQVIPAGGWTRWWGKAKSLLRDSGFFRVADKAPYLVELLGESISFEDELLRQFKSGDWPERFSIARKNCRGRTVKFPALKERVTAELEALRSGGDGPRALEAALVLDRISEDSPQGEGLVVHTLRAVPDPLAALRGVENAEDRRRAVEALPAALGESWTELALELLPGGDDALRDQAARLLGESALRDRAVSMVVQAARLPRTSPFLFAWAARAYLAGDPSPLLEPLRSQPRKEILRSILDLLDHLGLEAAREKTPEIRDLLTRARGLLSSGKSGFFRETIRTFSRDEAHATYGRVLSSGGMSEPLRVKLLEILMTQFPDISRRKERKIWEEDFIYVTQQGLDRKQEEFRVLTHEKLPKNFEDIGRAAAFGDLSENAEYTSALEERDRLTKKATELKADLDRVRIITPSLLKEGEISVGSRVRLVNPRDGREVTYRIFGPWDSKPDEGILSYRSPLAINLLGKRQGDDVQLPGGEEHLRVEEIASGFE